MVGLNPNLEIFRGGMLPASSPKAHQSASGGPAREEKGLHDKFNPVAKGWVPRTWESMVLCPLGMRMMMGMRALSISISISISDEHQHVQIQEVRGSAARNSLLSTG